MGTDMKTHVVNISRGHVCDVYIGRKGRGHSGYFGNPYYDGTREENIFRFRLYFANRIETDPEFRRAVLALRGKRLGCHCYPRPCHGDVYVQWLETNDA